jgi:A/G-specific adenine glycosylase
MIDFSNILIDWYANNKRDLPWRHTNDPYKVWLSEIILQQTRVEQGMPYYSKFVNQFKTVNDLANAELDEVLKAWQGLGYYSRARNLHKAAQQVVEYYGGEFPNTYKELLKLKGVGDYTASAIASFCFKESTPVLDGNVYRFISRFYGVDTEINTPKALRQFKEILNQLIDVETPDIFNQSIMEFGAMHCKPKLALCESCIFDDKCFALSKNRVYDFPVKVKSKKSKDRYFNYLVCVDNEDVFFNKRIEKDIWSNLYEFPLVESKDLYQNEFINGVNVLKISKEYKHKLSHQNIWAKFYLVDKLPSIVKYDKIKVKSIDKYPVHRLMDKFLNVTDWV